VNAVNAIAELKFASGRISKKPEPESSMNRKLLKELYE